MLKFTLCSLVLASICVAQTNALPRAKTTPVDTTKHETIQIAGSLPDALAVVQTIADEEPNTRRDVHSPSSPESHSNDDLRQVSKSAAAAILIPGVNNDRPVQSQRPRQDDDADNIPYSGDGKIPFLESDVEYCLRRAAHRFPPIANPDRLTRSEQSGVAKALRTTSCTRFLVRSSLSSPSSRNGLGNFTFPTLPPLFENFTLPFNLTFPTLFPPIFTSTTPPPRNLQGLQAEPTTKAPLFGIPCFPCPAGQAVLLSDLLAAIGECTTQFAPTCCSCVFKATIKAIFAGGLTTTAAPTLQRNDDNLDLVFFKK